MRPSFNSWVGKIPWRRKWQSTPALLPGKSHGWRSLIGYSPRGRKESDTTEWLHSLTTFFENLATLSWKVEFIPLLPGIRRVLVAVLMKKMSWKGCSRTSEAKSQKLQLLPATPMTVVLRVLSRHTSPTGATKLQGSPRYANIAYSCSSFQPSETSLLISQYHETQINLPQPTWTKSLTHKIHEI